MANRSPVRKTSDNSNNGFHETEKSAKVTKKPKVSFYYENGVLYKKCTCCSRDLPESMYGMHSRCSFGLNPWCKDCVAAYRKENIDSIRKKSKIAYNQNKNNPLYVSKNRERANRHYRDNRQQKLKYAEQYRNDPINKLRYTIYYKQYREKKLDHLRTYCRNYHRNNRAKITAYDMNRRRTDPEFHLRRLVSSMVSTTLRKKGYTKGGKTFEALGYTPRELMTHLENLFDSKMSWDNYGSYWVIDHIIPRCRFVYKSINDAEFKACWALENLQPLEKIANLIKSSK